MKNTIILILSITLLLTVSGFVYALKTRVAPMQIPIDMIPVEPISTTTQVFKINTGTTTMPVKPKPIVIDISDIDYSSLEKDRLYTKEEGKYANLSEVGKELLRTVLTLPKCVAKPSDACDEYKQYIVPGSSIVALKDDMLLVDVPGKGGYYSLYNLTLEKIHVGPTSYFSSGSSTGIKIRDDKFIVVVSNPNKWINKTTQNLFYYKPGMTTFKPIPLSDILPTESYWYYGDMGSAILEISLKNSVLDIVIFNKWKGEIGVTIPKRIHEATFDLNTLE